MLALDSSYESEEENPLKKLEEQEAVEFYNMVRSIFSSANINLKNEQLYSPLLEALIKNYSNKLSKREDNSFTNNSRRNSNWNLTMKVGPIPKFKSLQTQLLDLKSSQQLGEGMIFKENKPKKKPVPEEPETKYFKHEIDTENIKRIYRSELKLRALKKDINPLDKICIDLVGPAGSREWLNNDMELIDDLLCRQLYENDKKISASTRKLKFKQADDTKQSEENRTIKHEAFTNVIESDNQKDKSQIYEQILKELKLQ